MKSLPEFTTEASFVPKVASMLSLGGTVIVCGDLTQLKTQFVPKLLKQVDEYYSAFNLSFHEHPAGFSSKNISQSGDGKLLCIAGHPETALPRYAKKLNISVDDLLDRTDYVLYVEGNDNVLMSDLAASYVSPDFLAAAEVEANIPMFSNIANLSDYRSPISHIN
jgi:hypothetical protein